MGDKPNDYEDDFDEDSNTHTSEETTDNSESSLHIPIQNAKLQNMKTEIKQELTKEFQTQIQTEVQSATAPLGNVTGYVTIGAIALSVISILVLLVIRSVLISKITRLTTIVNAQKENIGKLTDELTVIKSDIRTLKNSSEFSRYGVENTPPRYDLGNSQPIQTMQAPPVQAPSAPSMQDKLNDFTKEFNLLSGFSGYELRKHREEFCNKYQIKGFSCKNFNERMNNPNLEPKFESSSNPVNCDYWAYEISSDKLAVVPNVKNYNENYHIPRAMVVVFNSNFAGGNYSNISVKNPAIFNGMWNLSEKGELVLS